MGPGGIVYDSDSSLTLAAAKSLSLSNSLSKQCGLELDQQQLLDEHQNNKKKGRRNSSSNDSSSSVSKIYEFYVTNTLHKYLHVFIRKGVCCIMLHGLSNYNISSFKFVILVYFDYEMNWQVLCSISCAVGEPCK